MCSCWIKIRTMRFKHKFFQFVHFLSNDSQIDSEFYVTPLSSTVDSCCYFTGFLPKKRISMSALLFSTGKSILFHANVPHLIWLKYLNNILTWLTKFFFICFHIFIFERCSFSNVIINLNFTNRPTNVL